MTKQAAQPRFVTKESALTALLDPAQGVAPDAIRDAAARRLPPCSQAIPDLIPFDAESKKALELTFRQALRMGHNYIGTEHLLLALLEVEGDDGVLRSLGIDKAVAEAHITAAISALSSTATVD